MVIARVMVGEVSALDHRLGPKIVDIKEAQSVALCVDLSLVGRVVVELERSVHGAGLVDSIQNSVGHDIPKLRGLW